MDGRPGPSPQVPEFGTPLPTGALTGFCPDGVLKRGAVADTQFQVTDAPLSPDRAFDCD